MKTQKHKPTRTIGAAFLFFFLIHIFGCGNNTPLQPTSDEESNAISMLAKKPTKPVESDPTVQENNYPQTVTQTFTWWAAQRMYKGGIIRLPNGSEFWVDHGVIVPTEGHPRRADITITMTCDKDPETNMLYFSFGPSGTHFKPYAQLFLRWADLGIDHPKLYYINEQNENLEQQPDVINHKGQYMGLSIKHFSRYAVGSE
jgi:hypothetical protein